MSTENAITATPSGEAPADPLTDIQCTPTNTPTTPSPAAPTFTVSTPSITQGRSNMSLTTSMHFGDIPPTVNEGGSEQSKKEKHHNEGSSVFGDFSLRPRRKLQRKASRQSLTDEIMEKTFHISPKLLSRWTLLTVCGVTVMVWIYFYLYVGSLWDPYSRTGNLRVALLSHDNFDQSAVLAQLGNNTNPQLLVALSQIPKIPIGQVLEQTITTSNQTKDLFDWVVLAPATTHDQLKSNVNDGDYWAAIYFPPNLTIKIFAAALHNNLTEIRQDLVLTGGANSMVRSIEYIYDEGRNYGTLTIITRVIQNMFSAITKEVGKAVLSDPSYDPIFQFMNPLFMLRPIDLVYTNLHPVSNYGENFASYVFFVCLNVGAIMNVVAVTRYTKQGEADLECQRHTHITAMKIVGLRVGICAVSSLLQALFLCLGLQILGSSFDGGFCYLWMFTWYVALSLNALAGFWCCLIGEPNMPVPMIFLLILQLVTSGGILTEQLMFEFFYVGKVFPFYYGVRGVRTLLFGSYDTMVLNCGIVGAWLVFVTIPTLILAYKNILGRWAVQCGDEGCLRDRRSDAEANQMRAIIPIGADSMGAHAGEVVVLDHGSNSICSARCSTSHGCAPAH